MLLCWTVWVAAMTNSNMVILTSIQTVRAKYTKQVVVAIVHPDVPSNLHLSEQPRENQYTQTLAAVAGWRLLSAYKCSLVAGEDTSLTRCYMQTCKAVNHKKSLDCWVKVR